MPVVLTSSLRPLALAAALAVAGLAGGALRTQVQERALAQPQHPGAGEHEREVGRGVASEPLPGRPAVEVRPAHRRRTEAGSGARCAVS